MLFICPNLGISFMPKRICMTPIKTSVELSLKSLTQLGRVSTLCKWAKVTTRNNIYDLYFVFYDRF